MLKSQKSIVSVLGLLILLSSCNTSQHITTKCSGGDSFKTLKDPLAAFPTYSVDLEKQRNITVKVLDRIEADNNAHVTPHITKFREDLNQYSSRLELIFKLKYLVYQTEICISESRNKFSTFIDKIAEHVLIINETTTLIEGTKGASDQNLISRLKEASMTVRKLSNELQ